MAYQNFFLRYNGRPMPVPPGHKQVNPTISILDDERIADQAASYGVEKLWLVSRMIWYGMRHVKAVMAEWKAYSESHFTDEDDQK